MRRPLLAALAVVAVLHVDAPDAAERDLASRLRVIERLDLDARQRTLEVAGAALDDRIGKAGPTLVPMLGREREVLALAARLLAVSGDSLARASSVVAMQAGAAAPDGNSTLALREALERLAAPYRMSALVDAAIRALDGVPTSIEGPVSRVIAASGAFAEATGSGVQTEQFRAARARLAQAVVEARRAFVTARIPVVIDVPPLLHIDTGKTDDVRTADYVVVLDAGGDDTYVNNAGGSGVLRVGEECVLPDTLNVAVGASGAAVLVDFGGDDRYGDPNAPRGCGANGGGVNGAGFLFDASGDDRYAAGSHGTNGGGFDGAGFLLDGAGTDTYSGGGSGVNGGSARGSGFLYDVGMGDDAYLAPPQSYWYTEGANGGAAYGGAAFLYDEGGDDRYLTGGGGTNGGGWGYGSMGIWSQGFLLDGGGNDVYDGDKESTNGGGYIGNGFLYDAGEGNDVYDGNTWMEEASNGAGILGVGFLLDEGGDDRYTVSDYGGNGAALAAGVGFLIDRGGDDTYRGGESANGTGVLGLGLLYDASGTDRYEDDVVTCSDCSVLPKGELGAQIDG